MAGVSILYILESCLDSYTKSLFVTTCYSLSEYLKSENFHYTLIIYLKTNTQNNKKENKTIRLTNIDILKKPKFSFHSEVYIYLEAIRLK